MREKKTSSVLRNERQWAALALATAAIGLGTLATGPTEGAQAATVSSASTIGSANSAATTSSTANRIVVASTASAASVQASQAVAATAVARTASQTMPASSVVAATSSAASSIANATFTATSASSQTAVAAKTAVTTDGQPPVASSAAANIGQPASTSLATTNTIFNWQTNETADTATITGVNQAVSGTLRLPSTYVANGKTYQVTSIGAGAFASQTGLTAGMTGVVFGNNLQTIGDSAFAYLNGLKTADFSADQALKTIGSQAFVGTGVTQVQLPNSVTTIGDEAFKYVGGLTTIQLPTDLVNLGEGAFSENPNLTTVDFTPATALTTIGDDAFAADGLTTLTLPATVQVIGSGAFMSNQQLTNVNFLPTSRLTTIKDSAFMYDTGLQTLTLPDSVQTIATQAFLADQNLQSVTLGSGVTSIGNKAFTYDGRLTTLDLTHATNLIGIGDGAFEYAGIHGTLTLPQKVQELGDLAFAGNPVTTLNLDNNLQTLGNDVFGSDQLVQITGPALPGLAQNQFVTIFADPHDLMLNDLLAMKLGQLTPADMTISGVTNATYQNGQFTVTPGQSNFTFNWSLANADGATVYAGQATVNLSDPAIRAINSTLLVGSTWQPADNFVSATALDQSSVPLSAITVKGTVNPAVAGTYPITYSYQDTSSTVTVTVVKRLGTYQLVGTSQVTYTGQQPTLATEDYQVDLPDGQTYLPQPGDLTTTAATMVGDYPVTLTAAGIAHLQALPESSRYAWTLGGQGSLQVVPAAVTITVGDETKVAGATEPLPNVSVSGLSATGVPLNYTVQRVAGETAGTYPITVTLGANPDYNVTVINGALTITAVPVTPAKPTTTTQVSSMASSAVDSSSAAVADSSAAVSTATPASSASASSSVANAKPSSSASNATSAATPVSSAAVVSSSVANAKPSSSASNATSAATPVSSAAVVSSSAANAKPISSASNATSAATPASSVAVVSSSAANATPSSSASMASSTSNISAPDSDTASTTPNSATTNDSVATTQSPTVAQAQAGHAADSAASSGTTSTPDRTGETHTVTGDVAVPATAPKSGQQGTLHVAVDRVIGKQPTTKGQPATQSSATDLVVSAPQPDKENVPLRKTAVQTVNRRQSVQSLKQATLPQTGESTTVNWSLGGILLGMLSVLGFRRRHD
ncbi:leucine-rich repeat protein [Levilactobacillus enshiensis]|uniref:leucine-rich repeat protein n=1 Tax=Levilactobacillus enshiensis TaxID=2590213 RepID=UPI00117B672E|nr:leucine-rich repeat protein [Levilactobacillus enshiensis]